MKKVCIRCVICKKMRCFTRPPVAAMATNFNSARPLTWCTYVCIKLKRDQMRSINSYFLDLSLWDLQENEGGLRYYLLTFLFSNIVIWSLPFWKVILNSNWIPAQCLWSNWTFGSVVISRTADSPSNKFIQGWFEYY